MDEQAFVERKQNSWQQLSESLDRIRTGGIGSLSRDQLAALGAQYRTVVSDLSYARAQGASEDLIINLNDLAGRAHGALYATRAARAKKIVPFLVREFPALFRSTAAHTLVAALIFTAGLSAAAYLVGTGAVPETKWAGPRAFDPASMSSQIMTNNIRVGLIAFAGGITCGVLSVIILFSNGLMLGSVAAGLNPHGRAIFWSFVPPHGVIELTAIFICGGAGLMIGSAIVAPGNIRRSDAVRLAAAKSIRLFAGTLPFFIVAGIIEGFVSPSRTPALFKQIFSGLTGLALIAYLGFAGRSERS